jgi:hypothetical protein
LRTPFLVNVGPNRFVVLQWMFPSATSILLGSVLMVNDKPQAMNYFPQCYRNTKDYYGPPVFVRFGFYRGDIITAADGNVDHQ